MSTTTTHQPSLCRKATSLTLALTLALTMVFATGCYTHEHIVGDGAQQGQEVTEKVWYVAYGLAPITEVDTREMAGGAEDYTIMTQQTFIDGLITGILFGLVGPRTVTVTR